MNARAKKILLLLLAVALLAGSGRMQKSLNHDRTELGLTIAAPLQNAPPMLAFTTVALGGFRGLISNGLWIRANDLQIDDKFFEAAQLATWITELEPHFTQVWIFQAWNMAYNISVKFKDFPDRWRWVERGIELLRDNGLRYNPNDTLIFQQLAMFFQHKMGANLDDANLYYKRQWAVEMQPFFGAHGTNFSELLQPGSTNATLLREKYKIDPAFAQQVDAQYGPLDWRLPEAHAIYWAARGLDEAKKNPGKVKPDDLITLRRVIYQSLLQSFSHGRLLTNPYNDTYSLAPNLDLIPRANGVYETLMAESPDDSNKIAVPHRNFLRNAVYYLYEQNRIADATKWFRYLGEKYPDKKLIDSDPGSFPATLTLDQYAVARVQEDIGETSQDRVTAAVQGLLVQAYMELAVGQDDRFAGFKLLANKVYENYQTKIVSYGRDRIPLPPYNTLNQTVLDDLLDTQNPVLPFAARAVIRTRLGMHAETNAPSATIISTNMPVTVSPTNAPAINSMGK